jgi:hypothetical protein
VKPLRVSEISGIAYSTTNRHILEEDFRNAAVSTRQHSQMSMFL